MSLEARCPLTISGFFKDLCSLPLAVDPNPRAILPHVLGGYRDGPPAEIIELDIPSSQIRLFVDVLQLGQYDKYITADSLKLSAADIRCLIPLTDRFDCPTMRKMLDERVQNIAVQDPWTVIKLASRLDDVLLGKTAIVHLKADDFRGDRSLEYDGASAVSTALLVASMPLMLHKQRVPVTHISYTQVRMYGHNTGRLRKRAGRDSHSAHPSYLHERLSTLQPSWQLEFWTLLMRGPESYDNHDYDYEDENYYGDFTTAMTMR